MRQQRLQSRPRLDAPEEEDGLCCHYRFNDQDLSLQ
jgi:hypothetical protein